MNTISATVQMTSGIKFFAMNKGSNGNNHHLTQREKEILTLVADGFTAQEVAEKLFLCADTVETHKRRIVEKLGARNTTHAVAKAISMDLIKGL